MNALFAAALLMLLGSGMASWPAPDSVIKGRVFYDKLDPKSPSFLYESRRTVEGDKTRIVTSYFDKSGTLLAADESYFAGEQLQRHVYKQLQVQEQGEVVVEGGKARFSFTSEGKSKTDSENIEPDMITSNMVGAHLDKHWQELLKDDTVRARFMLIERLETIGFKFFKDGERTRNGRAVVDFTMKPSSFIIAALVKPIRITMLKEEPHWIVETSGRLPIRVSDRSPVKDRGDYHAIDARVELDDPVPAAPPPGTVAATATSTTSATATSTATAPAAGNPKIK